MPATDSGFTDNGFNDHFSGHAADYATARPRFPAALFGWLAGLCGRCELAWDAGCGNGQASRALADHFSKVYATDPSAEQLAIAEAAANIVYAVEPAEQCGLVDHCPDLACVAQAMHWFDVPRFQREVHRVLRPSGVFAAWTYAKSRVMPAIDVVFDRFHDELLEGWWPAGREQVIDSYRNLPFAFEHIADVPRFDMRCDWTLPQYRAYLRSWSACQRYTRASGNDAVALIDKDLSSAWGDPAQARPVTWPLTVHVGRI